MARPGKPTNTSSITARSYHRLTVTIGFDVMRPAAAIVASMSDDEPVKSWPSENQGTAATTRLTSIASPRTSIATTR